MTFLHGFRSLRPPYRISHSAAVDWLAQAHARAEKTRTADPDFSEQVFVEKIRRQLLRFGPAQESLSGRGHHLEDYTHTDWARMEIHRLDANPQGADIGQRMRKFADIADAVLEDFYGPGQEAPDDIIHVTCTGYAAPGAAQKLAVKRGWQSQTRVLHAYHMGCFAALPAVRMAAGLLAAGEPGIASGRVDIVHNEVCTLHLDPSRHEPEQLVVQSLFGDGHIRYSAVHSENRDGVKSSVVPTGIVGLRVLSVHEALIPGTENSMSWAPGPHGMLMTLARDVPDRIAAMLRDFVKTLCLKAGIDFASVWRQSLFAVHPGGPRIIDGVAEIMELRPEQTEASRRVLRNFGNMSSATLPHIWMDMLEDPQVADDTPIISLAFGPGLTVHGCLLRKSG